MESIAAFILFFVLYRNRLQFSGWYKGSGKEKLPKSLSKWFVFSSFFLLILPAILAFI